VAAGQAVRAAARTGRLTVAERPSPADVDGPLIEVALTTFNSELFLAELLDSLFRQTRQDFTLMVADDGSTDSTLDIVAAYERLYPGRIRRLDFDGPAGGALANFSRLTDRLTARYVLFCDHDDVWLENKIALSVERIQALEAEVGAATPLLVHTDLAVVDSELRPLHRSLSRYQNLYPTRNGFFLLLRGNTVTGCAAIVNRALYQRARPVPLEAVMHDHWLALVAATLGRIHYVDESTILYRQHGNNALGAVRWGSTSMVARLRRAVFEKARRRHLHRLSRQAGALLARFGGEMTPAQRRAAEALANLWSTSRWRRFGQMRRHGLLPDSLAGNIALFVTLAVAGEREAKS
jgi:glycosyltransferase involved in cell wall biosynthesis